MDTPSVSRTWRSAALVLSGLVAGMLLLAPVGAHITPKVAHTWKHLKKKVVKVVDNRAADTAIAGFWDGPVGLPGNQLATVKALAVPKGSYLAFAKAWVFNTSGSGVLVHCRLDSIEGDFDDTRTHLAQNGAVPSGAALSFQVLHTFAGDGQFVLRCNDFGVNDVQVNFIKITAIALDGYTNAPLT